jgi:hypothetical protein
MRTVADVSAVADSAPGLAAYDTGLPGYDAPTGLGTPNGIGSF